MQSSRMINGSFAALLFQTPLFALLHLLLGDGEDFLHLVPPLLALLTFQTSLVVMIQSCIVHRLWSSFPDLHWSTRDSQHALLRDSGIWRNPTRSFSSSVTYLNVNGRTLGEHTQLGSSTICLQQILSVDFHLLLKKQLHTILTNNTLIPFRIYL